MTNLSINGTEAPASPALPTLLTALQHDYILLDASGSMRIRWWDSLTAINRFVELLQMAQVPTHIHLASFTKTHTGFTYDLARDCPISAWQPGRSDVPMRAGSTPLNDAINVMMRELAALDTIQAISHGSILMVTDGCENSSETSTVQARALLDWARVKGWQVTMLGCDFNNLAQSRLLGCEPSSSLGTSAAQLTAAAELTAAKRITFARTDKPMGFTDEERATFGGYLSDQSAK